ncbi:hypothetical protein [Rhizobium vallis]|uniref:hypothetical protein n=1 Tax=Rhizobium vallis TaxID=634290 RepID=UPI0013E02E7E|nr:hypothetical protein [Rhizobium vallis]
MGEKTAVKSGRIAISLPRRLDLRSYIRIAPKILLPEAIHPKMSKRGRSALTN